MPKTHTVASGENLTKIAKSRGYASWRDIYFHPDNKAFRKRRPDPNKIHSGDVIVLPAPPKGGNAKAPAQGVVNSKIRLTLPWNFAAKLKLPSVLPLYPVALPPQAAMTANGAAGAKSVPSPDAAAPATSKPKTDLHRAPSCLNATLPVPLPPQPLSDKDKPSALGSIGSALWACREVQEPVLDLVWNNAPGWQKGLEIGIGLTGLTTLLILNSTRDGTLNFLEGIPIPAGSAYPDDWAGARWIRPIKPSILWHETGTGGWNRGVIINYDLSGEIPEIFK